MAITNLADLEAALRDGGVIDVDPTVVIEVDSPLSVGQPTWLRGGTFSCPTSPLFEIGVSDVDIERVTAAGPGDGVLDVGQKLISAIGTSDAPLSNVHVSRCKLTGSRGINVWLEWCVDSSAERCTISDYCDSGVTVISGNRVEVAQNSIYDGHLVTGGTSVYGVAVTDTLNTDAARSRFCRVIGNHVHQVDWEGLDTHGGLGVVFANNIVTATRRSIAVITGSEGRIAVPQECVVSGNVIDSTGSRVTPDTGIFLAGAGSSGASATITGNTISGYDSTGQQPISAVTWDRANTLIGGNSRPHVPWTKVALSGGWTHNSSWPLMYMVDGNQVGVRGGAIPPTGGIFGNPVVGSLAVAAAWPSVRTFYAQTKGANPASATTQARCNVDADGSLRIDYAPATATDSYTYWFDGTYQAI